MQSTVYKQSRSHKNQTSINIFLVCTIITIIYLLISYINNEFLLNNEVYYNSLAEKLSYERIEKILEFKKKWTWLIYITVPLVCFIKIFSVATCLFTGSLLTNSKKVEFNKFVRIAIFGELVFVLAATTRTSWFLFFKTNYTLLDLQTFSPLSIYSLFTSGSIDEWLAYAVKTINIFEFLYCLVLAYGVNVLTHEKYTKSLKLISYSYGLGLTIWVVFVTFISLSLI